MAYDVDALVGFYTGVLGVRVYGDVSVPDALGSASASSPRGCRVVRLSTRSGQWLKIARPRHVGRQGRKRVPDAGEQRLLRHVPGLRDRRVWSGSCKRA